MTPEEPVVRVYDNLLNARPFTHSWMPEHTFPIGDATLADRDALRGLAGIEVHFNDPLSDELGFAHDLLLGEPERCYLYTAEPTSAPRSRVRSYKGLFWRDSAIQRSGAVEAELEVGQSYTHLVGIAPVTAHTLPECAKRFSDGQSSFIVASASPQRLSAAFAETVLLRCGPPLPGSTYANYLRLVLLVCPGGERVYRMGGYSGHGDADVQILMRQTDLPAVRQRVTTLLERTSEITRFGLLVQAMLGPEDMPGEESFDFVVCTPARLAERLREQDHVTARHHIIVPRYDCHSFIP